MSTNFCAGQNNAEDSRFTGLKKNAIHFTPGVQALTLSYERKLWHPKKENPFFKTITGRFEGGVFQAVLNAAFSDDSEIHSFYALSVSGITGKGKNHLEVGFGIARTDHAEKIYCCLNTYYDIYPSIGYRLQKPDGKFVFRAGVSHPRYTYISVGYAF